MYLEPYLPVLGSFAKRQHAHVPSRRMANLTKSILNGQFSAFSQVMNNLFFKTIYGVCSRLYMMGWGELNNFMRFLKLLRSFHLVLIALKEWSIHQKLPMI